MLLDCRLDDELACNSHFVAAFANTALEHIADAKLMTNLLHIDRAALICKARVPCYYKDADEKARFRSMENSASDNHFARLRAGTKETRATTSMHLDLVGDLKLVNAHLVVAAAYPVLASRGEPWQAVSLVHRT